MRNQGLPLHVNPTMRYKWDNYWGTWNRVLQFPIWYETDKRHLNMIEVDVTPVNGMSGDWDRIGKVWIRQHGTQIDAKDEFTNVIPMDWYHELGHRIGERQRDYILYYDILPIIDWNKYRQVSNGGAALAMIAKD